MKRDSGFQARGRAATLAALLIVSGTQVTRSEPNSQATAIAQAVEYCSTRMAPISPQYWYNKKASHSLNKDRTILCFDGRISDEVDWTPFRQLQARGILIVRSVDGNDHVAMAIADLLWDKDITVVIRDFCLSACAQAIAIASSKTIVLGGSVVAWRELTTACPQSDVARLVGRAASPCYSPAAIDGFLRQRGLSGLHVTRPPTRHTNERVGIIRRYTQERSVFWMWHPHNHRNYFQGKLVYETYPKNQETVDAIVRRFGLHVRVVYDPED